MLLSTVPNVGAAKTWYSGVPAKLSNLTRYKFHLPSLLTPFTSEESDQLFSLAPRPFARTNGS
jgi:hypothetical protein